MKILLILKCDFVFFDCHYFPLMQSKKEMEEQITPDKK